MFGRKVSEQHRFYKLPVGQAPSLEEASESSEDISSVTVLFKLYNYLSQSQESPIDGVVQYLPLLYFSLIFPAISSGKISAHFLSGKEVSSFHYQPGNFFYYLKIS